MGDLHIYQVGGMEDYLPKQIYYGNSGKIQLFCDQMTNFLFPEEHNKYFNNIQSKYVLNLFNTARNLAICNMRKNLVINKMNWYILKIIDLITENQCNYDGYVISFEASFEAVGYFPSSKYPKVEVEVIDCNDDIYRKAYWNDYREYVKEVNYLKRDYSDKLYAYTCNLLELYNKYFNENNSKFINIFACINADKCFGGRGFVEWK